MMKNKAYVLLGLLFFLGAQSWATDHNEPDLLNSFYKDRDGHGADIYGLFAYPSPDGENLNLIVTLAPVPATGVFDSKTMIRTFMKPSIEPKFDLAKISQSFAPRWYDSLIALPVARQAAAYKKHLIEPIIQSASDIFVGGFNGNDLPLDQTSFPEIRATFNDKGTKAKITFINFSFPNYEFYDRKNAPHSVVVPSNGAETDPAKIRITRYTGPNREKVDTTGEPEVLIFAGGRDDPFFSDIGGFFRGINWRSALNKNDDFVWEGNNVSYKDSGRIKESSDHVKRLIDRAKKEGVYDAKDWREGNNVNTLAFTFPVKFVNPDRNKYKLLRVWSEAFVNKAEFERITR